VARMKLDDLRRSRSLSQEQIAELLGINQGAVSKIEHRSDLYISTLRRFVHAAGGEIRIIAQFPGGEPIELDVFGDLEPPASKRTLSRA
jgi:transcriptional regulator with XRE-family HTH domain